ncbi:MAG: LamG-like jellyroll fold domain-containing protein [Verrucomicrobiota bacterium]
MYPGNAGGETGMRENQHRQWIEEYCNETMTLTELARFEQALEKSAELRADLRRYLALDAHLQQGAEGIIEIQDAWKEPPPSKETKWSVGPLSWYWAAAAALVFSIGLGLGSFLDGSDLEKGLPEIQDDGVAYLQRSVDAVWEEGLEVEAGAVISPGTLKLSDGLAQIEFYSGARLIVEGPAELELISANSTICRSGKLRAFIPPQARGFTVLSPQFELVDLGTEFGVEIGEKGEAKVLVFDGEVELYPPDGKRAQDQLQRLLGGSGLAWDSAGETAEIEPEESAFASFEDIRNRNRSALQRKFENWKKWSEAAKKDSRMVAFYDFEDAHSQLLDRGRSGYHGVIVGSESSKGRWGMKEALEFKRPGDRVRIKVPGEFDALTLSSWIRVDALTGRLQSLLLTDSYEVGRVHWQLSSEGMLRLGIRLPSRNDSLLASGYGSPVLFSPRRIGTWNLVCTTYDRDAGEVCHFLNGREVSREKIVFDQPLSIGDAEIGNWGLPFRPRKSSTDIRNFVGRIDELAIWRSALSPEEIREIYLQSRP